MGPTHNNQNSPGGPKKGDRCSIVYQPPHFNLALALL